LVKKVIENQTLEKENGGERGIRTLGTLARSTVFETAPFDHSGTSPRLVTQGSQVARNIDKLSGSCKHGFGFCTGVRMFIEERADVKSSEDA
jgi:hypothetical protein